jgi:biopolymer transport protein ExbD
MEGPKTQAITVNNEGRVALNTVPVTLEELSQKLAALQAKTREFPVVIRGDRATQYQVIMDVLNVVGNLGITQIGLATEPQK